MSLERNYKLYVHIAPNGKRYYGITKQKPEQRWANGKGYDTQYFARAIKKYGWDNIQHIVLHEGLDEEEAKELEQYMIQWYDTTNKAYGYNVSYGGDTSGECTEETRKKLSEALKGKQFSEDHKRKISEAQKGEKNHMYGKHLTEETKKKLSEAMSGEKHHMYGKPRSEETKKKISETLTGKHLTEETKKKIGQAVSGKKNPRAKSLICITTNKVFDAVIEAAKYYNIDKSSIAGCCRGETKWSGKLSDGTKLIWKYIDIIEL